MSKYLYIRTVFFLLAALLFNSGNIPPAGPVFVISKGSISFVSVAPYETIRGSSDELKGAIDAGNRTFAFSVSNRSIKGFNSPLQQEHFYENYIEADRYPASTFEGKIIEEIDFTRDGEFTVRAKGILNIHGVPRERIIKSTLRIRNGNLYVKSHFSILLEEHQITIPKIVYQKISKEILIDVEAEFTRKNS